jgi:hypothetical protein
MSCCRRNPPSYGSAYTLDQVEALCANGLISASRCSELRTAPGGRADGVPNYLKIGGVLAAGALLAGMMSKGKK